MFGKRGEANERMSEGANERISEAARYCGKCVHFGRCAWLISRDADENVCDWDPSRFRLRGEVER